MKGKTLLGLAAVLAAGAVAAVKLLAVQETEEIIAPEREEETPAPDDAEKTVAYPLKNKFTDYSHGEKDPIYVFELETPEGVKEFHVTFAHYETYYIGDEVICLETDEGIKVL